MKKQLDNTDIICLPADKYNHRKMPKRKKWLNQSKNGRGGISIKIKTMQVKIDPLSHYKIYFPMSS